MVHKELMGCLKLGKNQCRDFASQISGISICMLQYNILNHVKRKEDYETIGRLFAEVTKGADELSVTEKIWLLIVEIVNIIAETLQADAMVLTEKLRQKQ